MLTVNLILLAFLLFKIAMVLGLAYAVVRYPRKSWRVFTKVFRWTLIAAGFLFVLMMCMFYDGEEQRRYYYYDR